MYLPIDYVLFLLYSYGPLMSMIMSSVQAAPRPDVRFVAPHRSPGLVRPPFSKVRATKYLREYGWLPKPSQTGYGKDSLVTREEYEDALRAFQRFASLQETGVLDDQTIVKMLEPRCGVKDVDEDGISPMQERRHLKGGRYKRYTIEGSYWGVKKIKYRIKKYTRNMDRNKVSKVIRKSFKVWEEASPLRFIETNDKDDSVHINVMFVRRAHGDGEPFDGRGQILAHAFFPRYGGDVHFDEEEPWSTPGARAKQLPRRQQRRGRHNIWWRIKKILNGDIDNTIPQEGIDLYSVAAHEIGHSLGLKHSDNHHALMAPFYQGYTGDAIHLHKDDIKGLQHLYGKPENANSGKKPNIPDFDSGRRNIGHPDHSDRKPSIRPSDGSSPRNPHGKGGSTDICTDPSVDAITVIGNGTTYAFKGNYFWKLNQLSYEDGYPQNITEIWDGLPGNLDAAVTDYDGDTYFFKGDSYWLYDPEGRRYRGYPRKIAVGLVDVPNNLDAATIWNYDDKPYFFKGTEYWQYSRWGKEPTWPRSISEISAALPNKIDAALKWTNGKTYIFAGHQYYRLTGWRVMKVVPGYPRQIGEWWFGCARKSISRRKRNADLDDFNASER